MTDLELTKLCAEAIGIGLLMNFEGGLDIWGYDPLHDDAQAMALVKRFQLSIDLHDGVEWGVDDRYSSTTPSQEWVRVQNKDLNRAIVECVAKMQAAK